MLALGRQWVKQRIAADGWTDDVRGPSRLVSQTTLLGRPMGPFLADQRLFVRARGGAISPLC